MIEAASPGMVAVLVGVASALGIVVFIPILKIVMDIAEYSYANARISAMDGALIKKKRYAELVDVNNIEEFVGMLENTSYSEFLGKIGVTVDENSVESAIEKQYLSEKERIVSMLPDPARKAMGIYFAREEVALLKNILRRISSGLREFEGIEPVGRIDQNRLASLTEAESVKEFVARLEGTEYYSCMNAAYSEYEGTGNLIFLERAIDKYIMDEIWQRIAYSQMPLLQEFVGREIDTQNIMICLRAKVDGIKGAGLEKYIIQGGRELTEKKLRELVDSESVQDVISLLEGTFYGKILSEALPRYEEEGLSVFEEALRRYAYAHSTDFAVQVLKIGPTLAYLTRKENELVNLKTIIKCKSINMDKDKIEGLLVV